MYEITIDTFARENESGNTFTSAYRTETFNIDVNVDNSLMPRNTENIADYSAVNDAAIKAAKKLVDLGMVELRAMLMEFFRDLKEEAKKTSSMTYIFLFSVKPKNGWGDELNTVTFTTRYGMNSAISELLLPFPDRGTATAILAVVKTIGMAYAEA